MDPIFRATAAVLGSPSDQVTSHDVPSYEELHSEVQSILVPPTLPPGIQVNGVVPLTRQFAVSARGFLASEKKEQNPFAAMMGGGAPKSDKITRIWSLGGVFAHRFTSGTKLRLFSAIDSTNLVKTTGLCELGTSAGRLLLSAQVASSRRPRAFPGISYGLTAMLRGVDYTGCLRAATDEATHLPDVGVSYLQRLSPGSPLSLGGELWLSPATFAAVKSVQAPPPGSDKPLQWALGAAYDTILSKVGLHMSSITHGNPYPLFNCQYLYRVTPASTLVAKTIFDGGFTRSMAAAGYRVSFRNTGVSVQGMADTYGGVRIRMDREMVKDALRASFYLHYNALAAGGSGSGFEGDEPNALGIKVTMGSQPTLEVPQSPCTMNRVMFKIQ